jgi:hypothetical protein
MYLRCSADTWSCHFVLRGFNSLTVFYRGNGVNIKRDDKENQMWVERTEAGNVCK